jgi:hypothetical protein
MFAWLRVACSALSSVPVDYSTLRKFTTAGGFQRADRLGGLVHEYRVAA